MVHEFPTGLTPPAEPFDITKGPDGNMWFTVIGDAPHNGIGRITPSGVVTVFGAPATEPNMDPTELTVGPDGNLWFLDPATPGVGKITPAGVLTEFTAGLVPGAMPETLTFGADGNLWFTDKAQARIGRVTPDGTITEFPTNTAGSMPTESTLGADGNVWFSDPGVPAVGRVTPDGTVTEFTDGLNTQADPDPMTLGPDGNVWFIDQNSGDRAVGRITPSGKITEFDKGLSQTNAQDDITVGEDGNIWVEQASQDQVAPGGVARITPAGVITEFTAGLNKNPGQGADGDALVSGPDGNLWFSDRGSLAIGRISLQPPTRSTTATVGNQQIQLVTPSLQTCTAKAKSLSVTLGSLAIAQSRAAQLRFASAAFFMDKGVRHTHKQTTRHNGHKRTITVVSFTANAVAHHLPATPVLLLGALKSGTHTLRVTVSYKKTVTVHQLRRTVTVTKTVSATFNVC